jgi:hypothetical protein
MITKDNIEEVLKHNGIKDCVLSAKTKDLLIDSSNIFKTLLNLDNPNWLQIIEAHYGRKLEPLPEPNPFSVVKVGQWIRSLENIPKCRTANKWYKIKSKPGVNSIVYVDDESKDTYSYNDASITWDLTDIRDYNPDEEIIIKVGDEVEFIKYGKLNIIKFDYDEDLVVFGYGGSIIRQTFEGFHSNKSVNGRQGKYVIPPFDFKQTLLNAGWEAYSDIDDYLDNGALWIDLELRSFCDDARQIKFNPANAKRLIKLAELAEELEYE